MADDRQYHLKFDQNAAASVDAYLEYRRIVGEDDGGVMFSPEEYEQYKKKMLPIRLMNRLFTSWTSPTGMDCKLIGPETPCFCKHRYKEHKTDFEELPTQRPILLPCRARGCHCASYHYVPMNGGQFVRCTCKHTADDHSEKAPFLCKKSCIKCTGFSSPFSCACGAKCMQHSMIVETAEEREERGHPVGMATPYAAMGGITGFSSLAEGYMRLDPSGRGAPSQEFLQQEITSADNPFLRANVQAIKAHNETKRELGLPVPDDVMFEDMTERLSAMRRPGESELDYYERRYQEREKGRRGGGQRQLPDPYQSAGRRAIKAKPKSARGSEPQPGPSKS